MSLYNLKREYEERRRVLVEQLQNNRDLDPATQHQIYGAIKEIENFLKTIDYQVSVEQEKDLNVDLSRERPSPFVERTKSAVYHVAHGTKRVFTHHIPTVAKKAVAVPKQYFDKRKEEARLRQEIETEIRARKQPGYVAPAPQTAARATPTSEYVTLEHPHQDLPVQHVATEVPHQAVGQSSTAQPARTSNQPAARTVNSHVKRQKVIEKPAKGKAHPSKHAFGKKGGMHKPHVKNKSHR